MRIGHGYDAHRFASGRPLVLGGVTIPYSNGLAAHSNGDVVIHALCDALLGAAALGDIGKLFPDSSEEYRNIDSRILLREVVKCLTDADLRVSSVDVSIVTQRPRLAPHIADMVQRLSSDLALASGRLNIKATTTEGMGFTGRGEGIAVHAVVLLEE